MKSEEGVRFLVITVEENEFTVISHHFLHFTWIVDDRGTRESGVGVLVHGDVGVIGPEFGVCAWVWS